MNTRMPGLPPQVPLPPSSGNVWRRFLIFVGWMYLVSLFAVWLLMQWADSWWLATLVMFGPRCVLALPLAVLIPLALGARRRAIWPPIAASLILLVPVTGFNIPWRRLVESRPTGAHFRVLTCNMHYRRADPGGFSQFVLESGADVVAVQEWPGAERSLLSTLPDWYVHNGRELFLASRYPIRQAIDLGRNTKDESATITRYDLDTPAGLVHIFSLHFSTAREGIVATIHDSGEGATQLETNTGTRLAQSAFVAAQAERLAAPVLIVGDFNTPPESTLFQQVWSPYTDAFGSAGWGWGYTFMGAKTMVRIDHILASRGWVCRDCWVGPYVGSPHRPVVAELIWPANFHESK